MGVAQADPRSPRRASGRAQPRRRRGREPHRAARSHRPYGERIASELFDIALGPNANARGIDGRFRSGPLAGRTVNITTYSLREGVLDISAVLPDCLLVLAGPRGTAQRSNGAHRPFVIDEVFLFDARSLVADLRARGVDVGGASSVRDVLWEGARMWPASAPGALITVSEEASAQLRSFASPAVDHGHLAGSAGTR